MYQYIVYIWSILWNIDPVYAAWIFGLGKYILFSQIFFQKLITLCRNFTCWAKGIQMWEPDIVDFNEIILDF